MNITIDLSDALIRKLRAYKALYGGHGDVTDVLVEMLDSAVTRAIVEAVEPNAPHVGTVSPYQVTIPTGVSVADTSGYEDHSSITDGLGDEEPEEDESTGATSDEMAFVTGGGLRGTDLDHDMDVEDPEHEAKVTAPPVPASVPAERAFAEISGMPLPQERYVSDPRAARRRKSLNSKAKVARFGAEAKEESQFS